MATFQFARSIGRFLEPVVEAVRRVAVLAIPSLTGRFFTVLLQSKWDKPLARITYHFERKFPRARKNLEPVYGPGEWHARADWISLCVATSCRRFCSAAARPMTVAPHPHIDDDRDWPDHRRPRGSVPRLVLLVVAMVPAS